MRVKQDWAEVVAKATEQTQKSIVEATQSSFAKILEEMSGDALSIDEIVSSSEFKDAVLSIANVQRTVHVVRPSGVKHTEDIVHENFEHLIKMVGAGINVALVGEAGSGKSTAAEQCARALGLDFYPVSFHAKMTRLGGLLCLDEFDRSNTEVVVSLNNLLAGASYLFPNNELVKKHEDFRVVACQNTTGSGGSKQYAAAQRQDASTLNRFVTIPWDIDNAMERKIAGDTPITTIVQMIRSKAKELGVDVVISPRQSIHANTLVDMGYSTTQAIDYAITGMMADDVRRRLVDDIAEISNKKFAKK